MHATSSNQTITCPEWCENDHKPHGWDIDQLDHIARPIDPLQRLKGGQVTLCLSSTQYDPAQPTPAPLLDLAGEQGDLDNLTAAEARDLAAKLQAVADWLDQHTPTEQAPAETAEPVVLDGITNGGKRYFQHAGCNKQHRTYDAANGCANTTR